MAISAKAEKGKSPYAGATMPACCLASSCFSTTSSIDSFLLLDLETSPQAVAILMIMSETRNERALVEFIITITHNNGLTLRLDQLLLHQLPCSLNGLDFSIIGLGLGLSYLRHSPLVEKDSSLSLKTSDSWIGK